MSPRSQTCLEATQASGRYETVAVMVRFEELSILYFSKYFNKKVNKIAVQYQEIPIPGDSGVYSSPNSPDIRFVSGHQRSPGAMRARLTRTSLNSSDDNESRKTSHGSFSETIAGLLNLPSEVSKINILSKLKILEYLKRVS